MKRFLILITALLAATTAAFAQDFPGILHKLDEMQDFEKEDFSAVYSIVSQKPGEKPSETQARIFRRDRKNQFVILIQKPDASKGQGYLREDDNVWFYDPTSRKFSFSSLKENLQDSEAKNSDLTKKAILDDYTIKATSESTLGKYAVWVIELEAKNDQVSYQKVKYYVEKTQTLLLKEEDFSVSGRPMRTISYGKYVKVGTKTLPSQFLIEDLLNVGEKSLLNLSDVSVAPLPDSYFTKAFLERVSQ
jgi:outer membrane lipoprotein-sorting protein